jgi:hypothetical protein
MAALAEGLTTPVPSAKFAMSVRKSISGPGRSLSIRLRSRRAMPSPDCISSEANAFCGELLPDATLSVVVVRVGEQRVVPPLVQAGLRLGVSDTIEEAVRLLLGRGRIDMLAPLVLVLVIVLMLVSS